MYYAKKRKPLFSDIEVIDKDLYIKNNYHIYLAIIGVFTHNVWNCHAYRD
jgi:hypothetical protein